MHQMTIHSGMTSVQQKLGKSTLLLVPCGGCQLPFGLSQGCATHQGGEAIAVGRSGDCGHFIHRLSGLSLQLLLFITYSKHCMSMRGPHGVELVSAECRPMFMAVNMSGMSCSPAGPSCTTVWGRARCISDADIAKHQPGQSTTCICARSQTILEDSECQHAKKGEGVSGMAQAASCGTACNISTSCMHESRHMTLLAHHVPSMPSGPQVLAWPKCG